MTSDRVRFRDIADLPRFAVRYKAQFLHSVHNECLLRGKTDMGRKELESHAAAGFARETLVSSPLNKLTLASDAKESVGY
jgi:hypothetical protein